MIARDPLAEFGQVRYFCRSNISVCEFLMKALIWILRKLNRIYLRMTKILKNCLKDKKKLLNKLDVSGKKKTIQPRRNAVICRASTFISWYFSVPFDKRVLLLNRARYLLQTYGGKQLKKRKCLPNLNLGDKWKNIKKQIVLGLQHVKRQLMPWESQIKLEL